MDRNMDVRHRQRRGPRRDGFRPRRLRARTAPGFFVGELGGQSAASNEVWLPGEQDSCIHASGIAIWAPYYTGLICPMENDSYERNTCNVNVSLQSQSRFKSKRIWK